MKRDWQDIMVEHFGTNWAFEIESICECGDLSKTILRLENNVKELEEVAESWMNDYQKLKDKYEPTILVPQQK